MLDFTSNPGGIFPRIGRILHVTYLLDQYEDTLPAAFDDIVAQYATTLQSVAGPVAVAQDSLVRTASNVMAFAVGAEGVQNAAWDTIVGMVLADQPSQSWTRTTAMAEVVRQAIAQSVTVEANVIGLTPTALTGSVGTGVLVTSTQRGDGLVQENSIEETLRVVCTQDSYTGNATQGQEQFSLVGAPSVSGPFDYDYPTGSNAAVQVNAISSSSTASTTGTLLTNGDFEAWTTVSAIPNLDNWTLTGGVWGTDIKQDGTNPYQDTYDVEWIAGTAATPILYQEFNSTTGSNVVPPALASLAFNVWLKRVGVVTAGVLTIELVDSTGTVVNDAQGTPNTTTITLSGLTTSYVAHNVVFRLPANPPSVLRFRFHMSTALTGANVRMDSAPFAPLNAFYTGGPSFVVFSGAVPFVGNDGWSLAVTNNQGGATFAATFQSGWQRLFGMRELGLLLPSSGTPTISNTLITA